MRMEHYFQAALRYLREQGQIRMWSDCWKAWHF